MITKWNNMCRQTVLSQTLPKCRVKTQQVITGEAYKDISGVNDGDIRVTVRTAAVTRGTLPLLTGNTS